MNLGPTEFVIGLVPLALTLWGIIDAAIRPEWAFERAGQNKVLWLVLQIVGLCICLGWLLAIIYLLAIRPKVVAAQAGGPGGPYGGGPYGGGPGGPYGGGPGGPYGGGPGQYRG